MMNPLFTTRWTTRALLSLAACAISTAAWAQAADSLPHGRKPTALKDHLLEMLQPSENEQASRAWGQATLVQFHALVDRATAAEAKDQFRAAADDFALAAVIAPGFPQRDTLQRRLRDVLTKAAGAGRVKDAPPVDSVAAWALDRAFQLAYDRQIAVTPAAPSASGRLVVVEYLTGVQCGPCWLHDRALAAVLQRYPTSDVVVLGYHDGPGYPLTRAASDSLWGYLFSAGGPGITGIYALKTLFGAGDLGWIDGTPVIGKESSDAGASYPAQAYQALTKVIDAHRQIAPKAQVAMTVAPHGFSDAKLGTVRVDLRVTPSERRQHLGVRLVLVEDTVRVTGFTNRRLHYQVVRAVAWFGTPRALFSPLAEGTAPVSLSYTFDVAGLQKELSTTPKIEEEARLAFPDPATWRMRPCHLSVVALVQDMDTKEVLQTSRQHILPEGGGKP